MFTRVVAQVVVIMLSISVSIAPARAASPPDPGAPGPYAIGHTSMTLLDTSRNGSSPYGGRPIYVSLFYPADSGSVAGAAPAVYPLDPVGGHWPVSTSADWARFGFDRAYEDVSMSTGKPFPLVMFSPGRGGSYYQGMHVGTRLASHGFIVALLQHYGDGANPFDGREEVHVTLVNRPRDVSFALTAILDASGRSAGVLAGAVNEDQIAAAGHSLGGYAALVLSGGDDRVCDRGQDPNVPIPPETCIATPADPRIRATVSLDGSSQFLWFSEMARITRPAIVIGQEWENMGAWHAREHAAISSAVNYRVDVNGALHPSFVTRCEWAQIYGDKGIWTAAQVADALKLPFCNTTPSGSEIRRLATKYAIAFLKTHLVGETGYQHMLTPGWAITSERDIEFFVTERGIQPPEDAYPPCWNPTCSTFGYFANQPGSGREQADRDPAEMPTFDVDP